MPLLQWGKLRASNLPKVVELRKVGAQAGLLPRVWLESLECLVLQRGV